MSHGTTSVISPNRIEKHELGTPASALSSDVAVADAGIPSFLAWRTHRIWWHSCVIHVVPHLG